MKTIFISRLLKPESDFRASLQGYGLQITARSLLQFEGIDFEKIPDADWIFFYSQKAVTYFCGRVKKNRIDLKAEIKWGAIGPATAKALMEWRGKVHFTGDGDPKNTGKKFGAIARGQRVLFPRAAHSRRSLQKQLAGQIDALDLVVYKNTINPKAERPEADILVFTSPLNAEAYFLGRKISPNQQVVAIGQTTAGALRKLGVRRAIVAAEPSEKGLAKAVLELI